MDTYLTCKNVRFVDNYIVINSKKNATFLRQLWDGGGERRTCSMSDNDFGCLIPAQPWKSVSRRTLIQCEIEKCKTENTY